MAPRYYLRHLSSWAFAKNKKKERTDSKVESPERVEVGWRREEREVVGEDIE